ncbi:MAG: hypothetical protein JWO81_1083 [Alphaproteobacteria bacterium]|nr:hypothetical protein [Alphaproteobacteria bacterium]
MSTRYDELERLQRLRESGALTEEEFQVEKRRLLGHDFEPGLARRRTDTVEIIDDETAVSRTPLYLVLGAIGLVVAIAIGLLVGRAVGGGRAAPEANVALPENVASADENLIAPAPPADVRMLPLPEQLSRAFAAAFGATGTAQLQIAGRTLVYHPGRLFWIGDKAVLISPATGAGDCRDCAGTVAVHYLTPDGDKFQVAGSWPEAISGARWNTPPHWRMTNAFTTLPAIWEEGRDRGQDCIAGSAILTELTAAGPVPSGPIRTYYKSSGGLKALVLGDTEITGHATNISKDVSFDVVYSGDKELTETWVKQGDRFVPQGGESKVPSC